MNEKETGNLDSWDDFMGHWLKADFVKEDKARLPVLAVRSDENPNGDPQVVLTVEYNKKKWDFSLNKINSKFVKEEAKLTPRQLVNKILCVAKDKVYNPSTKTRVDSLFIEKVE